MKVYADDKSPPPSDDYESRWEGPDRGLICAWWAGRDYSRANPTIADAAKRGELPVLPFKGGVERATKKGSKIGAMHYLAMWQGLRSEDLNIDTDIVNTLVCTKTGTAVSFTMDTQQLLAVTD
jgi:hypothetical protein